MRLHFLWFFESPFSLLAHTLTTLGSANSAHSKIEQDNWHCEQDQQYENVQWAIFFFFFWLNLEWHAGSYFPDQVSNPCPLQWKCRVLTTGPLGKSLSYVFKFF